MQPETRIANHSILKIEVISWLAIIIVMGMILAVVGTGICETLTLFRVIAIF
jgi:hypothetical protein